MTYLFVIDHIATGGAERILIEYYHYLQAKGNVAYIYVLTGQKGQSQWTVGANIVYGSLKDEDNLLRKSWQQIYLLWKLGKLIKKVKPNVIFSFLEKSNLLTVCIPSKAKKIVSVHNVLSIQYAKIKSNKIRRMVYGMISWAYNRCPNVIAVSEQVKADLIESFHVKESHIHVINNYVDRQDIKNKTYEDVKDFNFRLGVRYIINIGRFSEQKAQWKLLKAFFIYIQRVNPTNVELLLLGNGDYTENLKHLAVKLGIDKQVTFLPFSINPYKYMSHAHLFVLSSIYEGFPIVLAEASSLRIPFIGTRKAIPEEMFDDKQVWEKCIFDSTTLESDFTTTLHQDEEMLASLLQKGVEDESFRELILQHTINWESYNDKNNQFELYDRLK